MEISVFNQSGERRWSRYASDFRTISEKTQQVLKLEGLRSASIIFVTPQMIHEMNRDYRGIDRPTDVISFAMKDSEDAYEVMEGEEELGDIFINIEAITAQAADYGHSLRREVCFLFTHGLLHLLGYDHETAEDKALMRALEEKILLALGLPRTALVTEGALAELTCGADDAAAPQGAAVLGEDGTLYVAAGPDGSAALAGALAKLPPAVGPLACACTAMPASPPPCPLYCRRDGGWYLPS